MGKIAHLVLKKGKENYMFGLTVGTLRAALWLNFVWEKRKKIKIKKEKPLGGGEEPGDQWGGKITYFGPKINHL